MDAGIVGSRQLTFDKEPAISAGWIKSFGVHYYFGNKEKKLIGFLVQVFSKEEVFDKIGLLDEIYNPAYYEETDLERRAIKAGFKIFHSPKSIFLHKGGSYLLKKKFQTFPNYFIEIDSFYFFKYYGLLYFLPRAFFDIFREFKKRKI